MRVMVMECLGLLYHDNVLAFLCMHCLRNRCYSLRMCDCLSVNRRIYRQGTVEHFLFEQGSAKCSNLKENVDFTANPPTCIRVLDVTFVKVVRDSVMPSSEGSLAFKAICQFSHKPPGLLMF